MKEKIEPVGWYIQFIGREFPDFEDDGLSGGFPDWAYRRWHLWKSGRVHDWHYCTRCHKAGSMTDPAKKFCDLALRVHARKLLPWYIRLAPWVLYIGVSVGGGFGSWDSCGVEEGDRCRHNIKQPDWMADD
jgi:hypothetical protein